MAPFNGPRDEKRYVRGLKYIPTVFFLSVEASALIVGSTLSRIIGTQVPQRGPLHCLPLGNGSCALQGPGKLSNRPQETIIGLLGRDSIVKGRHYVRNRVNPTNSDPSKGATYCIPGIDIDP